MFLLLYNSQVKPHLEYANPLWNPYQIKQKEALENVQRQVTCQIPSLKGLSYKGHLKKMDLYTLAYRWARGDMIEVFKIITGIYDWVAAPTLLRADTANPPTTWGNLFKLEVKRAEGGHNLRHNFIKMCVSKMWNKLPEEVITAPTIDAFKRLLA